ncbi:MAG TPA: MFS transporter [Candidatus Krumholzibacteria bacterium]|nr:MFS transporter [Candidatus Krumholzibacteria bacterium]
MSSRRRDVTLYLFGAVQLVALSADRLKQFSLVGMLSLLVPGSSVELLKLTLFTQVPILLLTPLAGALIDRWNKPVTILSVSLARAILLLGVPALYLRTHSIYTFYAAACVLSIFDLIFAPTRSALLPEVVPRERLLTANAVFWALGIAGTLAGFLAGGWLFDYHSWMMSFYANSLLYIAAATLMVPIVFAHRPPVVPPHIPTDPLRTEMRFFTRSISDAVRLLRDNRDIRASLVVQAGLFAVGGALSVIGIARLQEVAPPGKTLFLSQVGTAFIGGLIISSVVVGMIRERVVPDRTVSVGTLLCGVAIAGLGRADSLLPMGIWAGLLGVALSPVFIVTETLMQHQSPRQFTGRVFAAREALIKGAFIVTAVLATLANTFLSKSGILVGLGLFLALFGVILERTQWLKMEKS